MNIDQQRFSWIQLDCLCVLCALLTLAVHACSHLTSFPFPGMPIIKTAQDYDVVRNHPRQFQNQPFQLAGRIVRAETTPEGWPLRQSGYPFLKISMQDLRPGRLQNPNPIVSSICIFPGLLTTTAGDKAMSSSCLATWQAWKIWWPFKV